MNQELYNVACEELRRVRKERDALQDKVAALKKAGDQMERSLEECRYILNAKGGIGIVARAQMALKAWEETPL